MAREHLARRVTEKLAGGRFELIAPPDGGPSQFTIRHRPLRLIDAVWQRFAEEIAGIITYARCPAPQCGRWFPRSTGQERPPVLLPLLPDASLAQRRLIGQCLLSEELVFPDSTTSIR